MLKRLAIPAALFTTFFCAISLRSASAEPPKIDDVVSKLQEAETSASPVSILKDALEEMKKFNPKPNKDLMTARHVGPRKQAGVDLGASKHKGEAVEAIEKAIATAEATPGGAVPPTTTQPLGSAMDSPGTGLKAEIESAIGKVHMAGELKH